MISVSLLDCSLDAIEITKYVASAISAPFYTSISKGAAFLDRNHMKKKEIVKFHSQTKFLNYSNCTTRDIDRPN